jgi:hypothetical protein
MHMTSPPGTQHFILTRFNVRMCHFRRDGQRIVAGEFRFDRGLDRDYLRQRFRLFESYCYPCLREQSCQDFQWLVFFDAATPREFRERIAAYASWRAFVPVFVDGTLPASLSELPDVDELAGAGLAVDRDAYHRALAAHLRPDTKRVITTRLDNDDAVARDFVASIQRTLSRRALEVLNFHCGYTLCDGRLYLTVWDSNPFLSVAETIEPERQIATLKTALWRNHPGMASLDGYRSIETEPLWMRIAHGANLSALPIAGRRMRVTALRTRFAVVEAVVPRKERWLSYGLERFAYGVRALLAFARFALKRVLFRRNVRLQDYLRQLVQQ